MYGGSIIRRRYTPYIWAEHIRDGVDLREAENRIRARLEAPFIGEGWIGETELFRTVKAIFPTEEVVREASPAWLDRQRYDIFVPRLMLAIEYHGEQHYRPISHFGGDQGLQRAQARDADKRTKSAKAGVLLIEFGHHEDLTLEAVRRKIDAAISKR